MHEYSEGDQTSLDESDGLSRYLASVEAHMSGMPASQREIECAEIQQHLQEMIATLVVDGVSEGDAVTRSIALFGQSADVARQLTWEWRKTMAVKVRSTVRFIILMALAEVLARSVTSILQNVVLWLPQWSGWGAMKATIISDILNVSVLVITYLSYGVPLLCGYYIARRMPREATPEQAMPTALYVGLLYMALSWLPKWLILLKIQSKNGIHGAFVFPLTYYFPPIDWLILTCLAAYVIAARRHYGEHRLSSADWKLEAQTQQP